MMTTPSSAIRCEHVPAQLEDRAPTFAPRRLGHLPLPLAVRLGGPLASRRGAAPAPSLRHGGLLAGQHLLPIVT
jgi:hypothetical protein